jgi:enamine deaminase RidA (YjgF/YER057c/UK114 family)
MPHAIDGRLSQLGIQLPTAPTPAANYLPYVLSGDLLFIAGQAAVVDGKHARMGGWALVTLAEGQQAARLATINLIAQARTACGGDWSRLRRWVRLCGYVNCTAEFDDHPKVLDGASNLLVEIFGEAGRHARTAVGAVSLRSRTAVVLDAVVEIRF